MQKYIKEYQDNGFTIVRNFINKSQLEIILKDLEEYKKLQIKKLKGRDINFTKDGKLNSIHLMDNWKWTLKIQNSKKLKMIAKEILGQTPINYGAELFAKPPKTGLRVPEHQDNYYWAIDDANALTFWISLNSSSKKNGGIYYYKGSHKLGLLEHKPSYAPGSSQTIKYPDGMSYFKRITPTLKPGDCVIHNVLVVHGSKPNQSSLSRMGWTIRYISKNSKK